VSELKTQRPVKQLRPGILVLHPPVILDVGEKVFFFICVDRRGRSGWRWRIEEAGRRRSFRLGNLLLTRR
jgi:hypothetical protein